MAAAAGEVSVMQRELTDLQPQLVIASKEVSDIMIIVEKDSVEVAKVEKVSEKSFLIPINRFIKQENVDRSVYLETI